MVRSVVLALVLAAPGAAQAGSVDWSRAGGELFSGGPAQTAQNPSPLVLAAGHEEPRLASPDQPFAGPIESAAARHGLDPKLLHALVVVESAYRPSAVSKAGAGGLTQLMPATALTVGVRDRFDPSDNVSGGAAFLARQIVRFGDVRLALAAYNAGPDRVARLGRVPDIPETRAYVGAVVDCFLALTAGRKVRSARECRGTEWVR